MREASKPTSSPVRIKRELCYLSERTHARGGYVLALDEVELEPGWEPFAVQETRLHTGGGLIPADREHIPGKVAVFVWLRSCQ